MKGKRAWELHARSHEVSVKAYHADNGMFKAKHWIEDYNLNHQAMTFAGVNAHHQNGIAERRIKQLQDQSRSMLLHAISRCPQCVTIALWPYAIKMAEVAINATPSLQDEQRRSPLHVFSSNSIHPPQHFKPFGCPIYVSNRDLQQNKPHGK